jgi:hypothetical protein
MSTRRLSKVWLRNLTASILMAGAGTLFAADEPPAAPAGPSKETREQMATLHENMAACLRSNKEFAVCRDEMQKNCRAVMGQQACPMMGAGGQHGMMPNPLPKPDGT